MVCKLLWILIASSRIPTEDWVLLVLKCNSKDISEHVVLTPLATQNC